MHRKRTKQLKVDLTIPDERLSGVPYKSFVNIPYHAWVSFKRGANTLLDIK